VLKRHTNTALLEQVTDLSNLAIIFYLILLKFLVYASCYYAALLGGRINILHSVCPSVRPSVCHVPMICHRNFKFVGDIRLDMHKWESIMSTRIVHLPAYSSPFACRLVIRDSL